MRLLIGLLPVLLAAQVGGLQSLPTYSTRADVVTNGSFETGTCDNWTLTTTTCSSADARTGTKSVSFTGDTQGTLEQAISAIASRAYRIRFWYKTSGTVPEAAHVSAIWVCNTDNGVVHSGHGVDMPLGNAATWTQFDLSYQMSWGDEHFGHNMGARIHPDDLGAATVYIDDVTIEPQIVPLRVFFTNPNYRGMLWEDQSSLMQWKAIVELPDGKSLANLEAWVEIDDNSDFSSLITTVKTTSLAAVNTTGGKGAQWPGVSLNNQSFEMSGQADDTFYVRGKLIEKPSTVLYTGPTHEVIKENASIQRDGWNVWVDQYNRTVIEDTPTFVWGTFLNPVAACNGDSGPDDTAAEYKAYGAGPTNSGPQFTWWDKDNGTMLKAMADVGINTDIFFGNLSGGNIGVVNNGGLTGTISSSGTAITGSGTNFTSQLSVGDTINVAGLTGTGTVTSYGRQVVGSGTDFVNEFVVNDKITVGATTALVGQIDSATVLWTTADLNASADSFTINSYRTVATITDATNMTVDAAFPSSLSGDTATRNLCSSYTAAYSNLLPWTEASYELGIWHLHILASYHPRSNSWPTWAGVCREDESTAVDTLLTKEQTTGSYLGSSKGWLGTYVFDEPPPQSPVEGIAQSFSKARAAMDAIDPATSKAFGGVNFGVDGVQPSTSWMQWQFMDVIGSDPYTYDQGQTADDVVFGVSKADDRVHGRSYWWPRRVLNWAFDSRPSWATIQLYRTTVPLGLPPSADQRIELVGALAGGATGILWWEMAGTNGMGCVADDAYYTAWQKNAKVIQGLLPILSEPIDDLAERFDGGSDYGVHISSVSDSDVKCSSRNRGSQILLACTNTLNADQLAVEIALANVTTGTAVEMFSGQATSITGGIIGGSGVGVDFQALMDATAPEDSVRLWVIETEPAASRTRPGIFTGPLSTGGGFSSGFSSGFDI